MTEIQSKEKMVFRPCKICKKQFEESELLKCEGMEFCREDFGNGTIIIGLMNWNKENSDYKHPQLPKIQKEATFDEVYSLYKYHVIDNNTILPEKPEY